MILSRFAVTITVFHSATDATLMIEQNDPIIKLYHRQCFPSFPFLLRPKSRGNILRPTLSGNNNGLSPRVNYRLYEFDRLIWCCSKKVLRPVENVFNKEVF